VTVPEGKTMAIIRHPRFGVGDRGVVWLEFETYISEASAAHQILKVEDAVKVIEAYSVSDISLLAGKPCWVDTSKPGLITWIGPWKGQR
jgi:hypothetical protein